jgi:dolichol-phosphate mannosyltransferase
MELCILIPAKNEEESIIKTIQDIHNELINVIPFNILVINDHSDDQTESVLINLSKSITNLSYLNNEFEGGVGNAISYGLKKWKGDVIVICMADSSDSPKDILMSYNELVEGNYDCVFGSRFINGSTIYNYPFIKLLLNRLFNNLVKLFSKNNYNDFTNIFKMYSRNSIIKISPIDSKGFSIGLEMSLKGFSNNLKIKIVPISWMQRTSGQSKLNLLKNVRLYFSTLRKCL